MQAHLQNTHSSCGASFTLRCAQSAEVRAVPLVLFQNTFCSRAEQHGCDRNSAQTSEDDAPPAMLAVSEAAATGMSRKRSPSSSLSPLLLPELASAAASSSSLLERSDDDSSSSPFAEPSLYSGSPLSLSSASSAMASFLTRARGSVLVPPCSDLSFFVGGSSA